MNIHLWTPDFVPGKGGIQVFSRYLLEALCQIPEVGALSVFCRNGDSQTIGQDPIVRAALSAGKNISCYGGGTGSERIRQLAFAGKCISAGLREKPDLIITTHLNFSPLAALLGRLRDISYWTVAHGIDAWEIPSARRAQALSGSEKILAVSHFTREKLVASGKVSPGKVVVFPNTVDTERFKVGSGPKRLRERHGLEESDKVILTIARLAGEERYKGYDQLIRALPKILETVPNVKYLIGGTGPDRPRIETMIREAGLGDCVILAGFIPDEELNDYYNLCDLFAMPSKGEGFGIVFLEALSCGKPVLAGNKDGSVDAVNGGKLGVLVDPDNVAEITTASIQILQGNYPLPILYQPEALRREVTELYGLVSFGKRLEKLLELHRR